MKNTDLGNENKHKTLAVVLLHIKKRELIQERTLSLTLQMLLLGLQLQGATSV